MQFNITLPSKLRPHYRLELAYYRQAMYSNNLHQAWYHLERAHIIGQSYPYEHSYVHWKMLLFGIRIKNFKEILGQIPRLLVGGVKSFVDHIPIGNTGGANVPPLRPMEIPVDIQEMFRRVK